MGQSLLQLQRIRCINRDRWPLVPTGSSFSDGPKDQISDVQLRIGESLDSGFVLRAPWNDAEVTLT